MSRQKYSVQVIYLFFIMHHVYNSVRTNGYLIYKLQRSFEKVLEEMSQSGSLMFVVW